MGVLQDPLILIKEASRQSAKLEPYNNEAVHAVLQEIESCFSDARAWNFCHENNSSLFENANQARTIAVQNLIQRNTRILAVYHLTRLKCIADIYTSVSVIPESFKNNTTTAEACFLEEYSNIISEYSKSFKRLFNIGITQDPPRELYIQIKVNQDCGIIQTEQGQLHLNANTLHFVRRPDVQNLIDQGFVTHVY